MLRLMLTDEHWSKLGPILLHRGIYRKHSHYSHWPILLTSDLLTSDRYRCFIVLRGKPGCFSAGRDSASCAARLGVPCPRLL
ncbi:hypothetical protein VRRI112168_17935 [Vreelandella rituensis]